MNPRPHELRLEICKAEIEMLYDIYLCAEEFNDLVDTFKEKFLNKDITISMAFYDDILSGFIVAEDKSQKVDAIEKLIPTTCLHLLYVNSKFRKKHIGKFLFDEFIKTQKEKGTASIYIKIPQKYKNGINPFQPWIDLWHRGFVPSFDGTTWRLHSGKKAEIVYKTNKFNKELKNV